MRLFILVCLCWLGCVTAQASNASVEVSWNPPTNGSGVVDGYYVCYGTNSGHYYNSNEVCDWATSNCLISGFGVFGGPYYFAATSFGGTNISTYSNETNWTPTAPSLARISLGLLYTNIPSVGYTNSPRRILITNYWYVGPSGYIVSLTNPIFTNYTFSVQVSVNASVWKDVYTNKVPFVYTDKTFTFPRYYRLRYLP